MLKVIKAMIRFDTRFRIPFNLLRPLPTMGLLSRVAPCSPATASRSPATGGPCPGRRALCNSLLVCVCWVATFSPTGVFPAPARR